MVLGPSNLAYREEDDQTMEMYETARLLHHNQGRHVVIQFTRNAVMYHANKLQCVHLRPQSSSASRVLLSPPPLVRISSGAHAALDAAELENTVPFSCSCRRTPVVRSGVRREQWPAQLPMSSAF
jgi:hypothetical protein